MGFCSNCGKKFEEDDLFCQNCGFALEELHEEVIESRVATAATPKRNRAIFIGLGALVLIGGGGYYAMQYFYPSQSQVATQSASESSSATSESEAESSTASSGAKIKTASVSELSTSTSQENTSSMSETSEASASSATVIKRRNESGSVATSANSEGTANATSEVTTTETTFSTAGIEQLFNNQFGSITGKHALYFQDITNANGEVVASTPLVLNDTPIRSASTIKLFVLAALFERAEQGTLSLDTVHTLKGSDIVGGTGVVQNSPAGTPFTLRTLATEMIISSDNTAMNIIIDYLGFEAVNHYIKNQGYTLTSINRKMLDSAALAQGIDNYISAREAGDLMRRIYTKTLVSPTADEQMLNILSMQKDKTNLEASLPAGAVTYNKTGQYADYGIRNDVSIVSTPKGAYVLVVLSQDGNEQQQIATMQSFGQNVYQTFMNQ